MLVWAATVGILVQRQHFVRRLRAAWTFLNDANAVSDAERNRRGEVGRVSELNVQNQQKIECLHS